MELDGLTLHFSVQYTTDITRMIFALFAVMRLVDFFMLDDGPDNIAKKIRIWCLNKGGSFEQLIECPYCLGLWLSVPVALLYYLNGPLWDISLFILGLAGMQSFLQEKKDDANFTDSEK